ncbi:hypothetical protein OA264_03140 [Alphaproteobacteria bacterium]|nr:hypothetical protein [Alphaproteobacteria bacterium]
MDENKVDIINDSSDIKDSSVSFLKIDALRKNSHAFTLLLRTDDIIVGVDKTTFRGTQKLLNQILKDNSETVLTILRKNTYFNVLAKGPLGIKLIETNSDDDASILENVKSYLDNIENFENYKEFEVFRGKKNLYNILEVNESSLFASLFPLVWLFHNKLYLPLFLIVMVFILLGSVQWWLFMASWIILTVYMTKGSMSILRSYCLYNEMRVYAKIYAENLKAVQLVIRQIDKKSHYTFPLIDPPILEENKEKDKKTDLAAQPS